MKSSQPNTLSKGVCIQKNVRETLAMDSILGKQEISKSNRKEKKQKRNEKKKKVHSQLNEVLLDKVRTKSRELEMN